MDRAGVLRVVLAVLDSARDTRGSVSTMFAFALLPLMVFTGTATDFSVALATRAKLQNALDAAVLRGIQDPVAARIATATQFMQAELGPTSSGLQQYSVQFTNNADGSLSGTTEASVPTQLMSLAGIPSITVGAQSSALPASGSGSGSGGTPLAVCMLLLEARNSQALVLNSGANITATTCEIDVATSAGSAVTFNASTTLDVSKICLKGNGYIDNGGVHATVSTNCQTIADPYTTLPDPPSTTCAGANSNGGNFNGGIVTLTPGVYCGWFNFNGAPTVILQPGVYVIENGGWNVNGGVWAGVGVTIYFADSSKIQFNSGMTMSLVAPLTGPYAGILFYEKMGLAHSQLAFDDTLSENLVGLIHLPSRDVTFNSTSKLTSLSLTLIANTAIFNTANWTLLPGPKTIPLPTQSGAYRLNL